MTDKKQDFERDKHTEEEYVTYKQFKEIMDEFEDEINEFDKRTEKNNEKLTEIEKEIDELPKHINSMQKNISDFFEKNNERMLEVNTESKSSKRRKDKDVYGVVIYSILVIVTFITLYILLIN